MKSTHVPSGDGVAASRGTLFEPSRIPSDAADDDARVQVERIVAGLGLERYAFVMLRLPRNCEANIYSTAMSNYPQAWVERYIERNYALIDPVIARARRETRPFFWTTGTRFPDPRQCRLMAEARDFGIAHGVTIPLRSAEGGFGVFTGTAPDAEDVRSAVRHNGHELLAVAHDALEFAQRRVMRAGGVVDPGLSSRERECLLWALEGKTAAETAVILGLSVFTVNRHTFNATHKLGSLNKHHAAVRAHRTGLL